MFSTPSIPEASSLLGYEGRPPRSSAGSPLAGEGRGSESRHAAPTAGLDSGRLVEIWPSQVVTRRTIMAHGMTAEIVHTTSCDRFESRFQAPLHLLIVYEQCSRRDGESFVEGLPRSTLRELARRLTFVPAGRQYYERHEPRTRSRLMYVHFDPAMLRTSSDSGQDSASPAAMLLFDDAALLDTALKLKRSLENADAGSLRYMEALGVVLAHEIVRLQQTPPGGRPPLRGGLAAWQRRLVTAHIDAHLGEPVSLAALADLARLSPSYFCRAFRQSFGVPPHKYHTGRRIEHAMALLATRSHSVTEIGMTVGYSETSSFTAAFRKAVGLTPSAYQRNLDK